MPVTEAQHLQVHADRERCVGAGQCLLAAPEIFDQADEDGVVVVLQPNPPIEAVAQVRAAVEACPARALALTEGDS